MLEIKTIQCNMLQENCYIVSDETGDCVIIDCGALEDEEKQEIKEYILQKKLTPQYLLATHGHLDHNFGNAFICHEYILKPFIHEGDAELLADIDMQAKGMLDMTLNDKMPEVGGMLEETVPITFGKHQFKIIHTPGHTRGSVIFYCPQEHVAFTGDTLFRNDIGRTDLPGGSMFAMIQSLRQLSQLPDQTTIYPGHGPKSTIGYELAHNPYMDR